jgi:transcriptional regulator with XRE-family HTH domain
MNGGDFQSFLNAKLKEQGLTFKKLSEISGISLKHLENLNSGNISELPAAPYVHGYLLKLGQILDFDGDKWWQLLKEEEISTSGAEDQLPKNRFSKKPLGKKIWLILAVFLIILYFGLRFSKIFGRPEIIITYPKDNITVVNTNEIIITGELKGGDKIMLSSPVSEQIPIDTRGLWQKNIRLDSGANNIEITAKKFLGREAKITRQIIYEPPEETPEEASSSAPIN